MKTPDRQSPVSREELTQTSGDEPIVQEMLQDNEPLTAERYLELAYPDRESPIRLKGPEEVAGLPEPFRDAVMDLDFLPEEDEDPPATAAALGQKTANRSPRQDVIEMVAEDFGVSLEKSEEMVDDWGVY